MFFCGVKPGFLILTYVRIKLNDMINSRGLLYITSEYVQLAIIVYSVPQENFKVLELSVNNYVLVSP